MIYKIYIIYIARAICSNVIVVLILTLNCNVHLFFIICNINFLSYRGFFRSDSLLGIVTVKLQPLETQCVLHDSFPVNNKDYLLNIIFIYI